MKIARTIVLSLSLFAFGCAAVSADTAHTSPAGHALVVEVAGPPPPAKPEVKPPCPAPGYIWVGGYWDYIGGHHVWRDGRWLHAKADYEYVRARYEWDGHAWHFHVPHWHRRAVSAPTQMANRQ